MSAKDGGRAISSVRKSAAMSLVAILTTLI